MFMVVIGTFAWNSLKILTQGAADRCLRDRAGDRRDGGEDLATAVVVGVIVSALAYAWNNATRIHAKATRDARRRAKVYQVRGRCSSARPTVSPSFSMSDGDPKHVVIVDFADSRVVDQSALQAIEAVAAKYEAAGKTGCSCAI
jgi:SulP family sulfate permease